MTVPGLIDRCSGRVGTGADAHGADRRAMACLFDGVGRVAVRVSTAPTGTRATTEPPALPVIRAPVAPSNLADSTMKSIAGIVISK